MRKDNYIILEINKSNTKLIAENNQTCYVHGIGNTDYTIHRDADEIKQYYFPKYNFFVNWSINLMHNYHVFQARLKSLCGDIKFRNTFNYKGELINVKRGYIGIPNYCAIEYIKGHRRRTDTIICNGSDYKLSNKRLMYIIEIQ